MLISKRILKKNLNCFTKNITCYFSDSPVKSRGTKKFIFSTLGILGCGIIFQYFNTKEYSNRLDKEQANLKGKVWDGIAIDDKLQKILENFGPESEEIINELKIQAKTDYS